MKAPTLQDILLLMTIPHVGPGRIRSLLNALGSAEAICKAPVQRLQRLESIDRKIAFAIRRGGDDAMVEDQLKRLQNSKAGYVTLWDQAYPQILRSIPDAPPLLFYLGKLPDKWPPAVAIVGTRRPSHYGISVTEKLTRGLIANGISIVSGFARGVDTVAHRIAVENAGQTAAVLGCGVDYIYPPENRKLYSAMVKEGCILSDFFLGAFPDGPNFPKRNRIIAGLAAATIVIEAGEKSGALITANYALEYNREVMAVPGPITSERSIGPNRLIQQGAKTICSVDDVLEEIVSIDARLKTIRKPLPAGLSELELRILDLLDHQPRHIDQLIISLQESPAILLARLLELELLGLVRQLGGKMFVKS